MPIFCLNNTTPSSRIQQTSNSSEPQLFGITTSSPAPPFGASSISFGGTSAFSTAKNVTADQTQKISPGSSTIPAFGKKYGANSVANEPLLWSKDANVSDSSLFASGVSSNSHFGTPKLDSYSFGQPAVSMSGNKGTSAFNAAKNVTADRTQNISPGWSTLPTFGKKYDGNSVANEPLLWSRDANVSDSSIFGSLKAAEFDVSSNSHLGTARFDSYSFGQPAVYMSGSKGKESTTPLFRSYDFGRSAFGGNQKGSRTASYTATPDKDSINPSGGKIQSICGMQTYKDKSQEELRFEDYQLGDKGQQCGSSFGLSGTKGFGIINNTRPFTSPVFNQSTAEQPFHSHFPRAFAMERTAVDSLSNSTETASTPFPKSQQSISHIFSPKPSVLSPGGTGSRVESTASDVSFSPWIHARPFAPLKPASSSSTTSTFPPLSSPWGLSSSSTPSLTQSPLSASSVSPSTYPLSPTPVLTTGGAPQSTFCLNCRKQSQPTPPGLCNDSNTLSIGLENSRTSPQISTGYHPLAASQNNPLSFGLLQTEMTPKSGTTLPTTISSLPSTGSSRSEIGQGIGQPSINGQQSYFPRIMEMKPSPIMPPAETEPSSVQIVVEHPNLTTSIQYGISSLPVSNNPAPVRRKSSLIIRHSSLSRHKLPPQKYKSSNDKPKVPFFMDKENPYGLLRTEVIINPRENPRDWIRPATTEFSLGADSCTSQLKNTSTDSMHDGEKTGDKPKLEPEEIHYDNCGQLKHCGDDKDVDAIMPKLQRADYYTIPPVEELISKEKEEAGFCCRVKDLVVGRHGYGSIKFLGETDVRKLDLDSVVHFNCREVIIYMDESKKPSVGQGLNKPAEITLLNVRCINKSTGIEYKNGPLVNKYRDMLIKKAGEQDAEFISYDPVEGEWKFRVSHF